MKMKWQRRLTIIHSFVSHQYLMSFILIINNRLHLEKKVFLKRIHWIAVTLLLAVSYCSPYSIKDNRSKDNGTQNLPHQFVLRTNKSIKTCTPSFFTCLCFIWKWRSFVATKWIWYYHFAMNVNRIIDIFLYDSKFRLFLKKKEIAKVRWIWVLGTSQCILFLHDLTYKFVIFIFYW